MSNYREDAVQLLYARRIRRAKVSWVITVVMVGTSVISFAVLAYVVLRHPPKINLPSFASAVGSAPSTSEIYSAVEHGFRTSGSCAGTRTVKHLRISRVGEYAPQFGGFPVYGSFSKVCRTGKTSITTNSSKSSAAAITFVRRSLTGWQAFTPEIFQQAEDEMQRSFNKMLGGIK